jgi:hypothetical protein
MYHKTELMDDGFSRCYSISQEGGKEKKKKVVALWVPGLVLFWLIHCW